MSIFTVCALALLISALALMLKGSSVHPLLIAGGALLLFSLALDRYSSAVSFIYNIAERSALGEELTLIFKCAAVAICASMGAGVCRDLGQSSLADKVELFSSLEIIVLSLPYIESVLTSML